MEVAQFARQVLTATTLEDKLAAPTSPLVATVTEAAEWLVEPGRPANLQFASRNQAPAMPRPAAFADPRKRAIAHHVMANHELQALEVMALVVLAFPDLPAEFRLGLADILQDEQRHTRMHAERAKRLGIEFGDLPVNCYIWKKAQRYGTALEYLAGLPLLFEGANLDHSLEFADAFDAVGDQRSAAVMRVIHRDEIGHVRFGIEWLRRLKPAEQSDFEAFVTNLHWPMRPTKARGRVFQREARLEAGLTEDFVQALLNWTDPE